MIKKLLFFFSIAPLFYGCAVYMPASEAIIYHDQEDEPYLVESARILPHGDIYATLSYVVLPELLRNDVRQTYRDQPQEGDRVTFDNRSLITLPTPLFRSHWPKRPLLQLIHFPFLPVSMELYTCSVIIG